MRYITSVAEKSALLAFGKTRGLKLAPLSSLKYPASFKFFFQTSWSFRTISMIMLNLVANLLNKITSKKLDQLRDGCFFDIREIISLEKAFIEQLDHYEYQQSILCMQYQLKILDVEDSSFARLILCCTSLKMQRIA